MRDENEIVRQTQLAVRCEMDREGLPLKVVAAQSGIKETTFMSYFKLGGTSAVMSLTAFRKLCGVLPERLLSLFLPDGFQVVRSPEVIDYDIAAEKCRAFLSLKDAAHHLDSPAQRELSECELDALAAAAAEVKAAL